MLQRHSGAFQRELAQVVLGADGTTVAVAREFVDGIKRLGEVAFVQRKADAQTLFIRLGAGDHIHKHAVVCDNVEHAGSKRVLLGKRADDDHRLAFQRKQARGALVFAEHIFHVVEAALPAGKETRGAQRTLRKRLRTERAMRNLDNLVVSDELHLMFADHRAAANGVDTNFVVRTALVFFMPSVDELLILRRDGGDSVGKHQRGSAGTIHLLTVMRFNDLHVETGAEGRGGELDKLHLKIDAERHIARLKHRDAFGSRAKEL
ncbi:hypothetical protein SDC9_160762 [bioreactor metagenome]|uniref:Uncharacterized protein n=1 Tax=bioreactor metagenome TaxID=1076179 RepID=A0A645FGF2_9ZZZZ